MLSGNIDVDGALEEAAKQTCRVTEYTANILNILEENLHL